MTNLCENANGHGYAIICVYVLADHYSMKTYFGKNYGG